MVLGVVLPIGNAVSQEPKLSLEDAVGYAFSEGAGFVRGTITHRTAFEFSVLAADAANPNSITQFKYAMPRLEDRPVTKRPVFTGELDPPQVGADVCVVYRKRGAEAARAAILCLNMEIETERSFYSVVVKLFEIRGLEAAEAVGSLMPDLQNGASLVRGTAADSIARLAAKKQEYWDQAMDGAEQLLVVEQPVNIRRTGMYLIQGLYAKLDDNPLNRMRAGEALLGAVGDVALRNEAVQICDNLFVHATSIKIDAKKLGVVKDQAVLLLRPLVDDQSQSPATLQRARSLLDWLSREQ
jgi:hypothetical protein